MAKTEKRPLEDAGLEAYFTAARAKPAEPSADLLARVMADADTEAARRTAPQPGRAAPSPGFWATLSAAIGGWPAAAGLVTATLAGVWLGFAPPDGISGFTGGLLASADASAEYELEDFMPGYGEVSGLLEEM